MTKVLKLRNRTLEAHRELRVIRPSDGVEPDDVVSSESLLIDGKTLDVNRHRETFERILDHGR